jgi:glycosyltransferase involved in cell wall biosynthesis
MYHHSIETQGAKKRDSESQKEHACVNQGSNAEIIMVDLTCRTPPYDRALCEALESEGVFVEMWAAGCYSNALYDSSVDVVPGALDLAAHLPFGNEKITKILKAAEYLVNLATLLWRVVRDDIDLVHFQWLPLLDLTPVELKVVEFIQQQGTPVAYTVHNVLPHDSDGEESERRRFEQVYRSVDTLVCHTKTSRRRLVEEFGIAPSKIWHIPHGPLGYVQDSSEENARVADVLDVDPQSPLAVMFGVIRPYKGYDFLLRAWPKVVQSVEAAQLAIVGQADDLAQETIEFLVDDLGVDATVSRVYRYVSEKELHSVIQAADVLVYPYRDITQSGALFTGMSAGKAIVATDVGGFPETLRDEETGCIVEFGNQHQLATVLANLLTDPNRREKLGEAVRRDLETRFSWEEIARQTAECYQSTMKSNPHGIALS